MVETTFVAAAAAMVSTSMMAYFLTKELFNPLYVVNGILMGLIVITPLAGFVSPGSALILGCCADHSFATQKRLSGERSGCRIQSGCFRAISSAASSASR